MFRRALPAVLAAALFLLTGGGVALAAPVAEVSERDFLQELPVVLSVSRLAQPLDETPGAVTVIDRDMIRRSGAREPAELLRLVPGFQVTQWNGASPLATYHGGFSNNQARHVQVLVDGRSVYSTYFLGDTARGLMGLVLEDIERIEVLRGSNSAAFGANAFLGVINIVTRNAMDTRGGMVSFTSGERGIADNVARLGFGNDQAALRLTASRRSDTGFVGLYDDKNVGQFHLRGDVRPTSRDDISLAAGSVKNSWGDGFPGNLNNLQRTVTLDTAYAQGQWRRNLERWGDAVFSASYDEEKRREGWLYLGALLGKPISTPLDYGGSARRTSLQGQHSFAPGTGWRVVWGGEYRYEQVKSPPLYYVTDSLSNHQWRWFGNVEWKPHERWVINAGGLWETDAIVGSRWSPRLMANFHLAQGHTFRIGATEAHRAPTLYELRGDTRWFDTLPSLAALTPFVPLLKANLYPFDGSHYLGGVLLANSFRATGNAKPETILSREIGYLGEFRPLHLTVDVRAFDENVGNMLRNRNGPVNYGVLGTTGDAINAQGPSIFGWEYQARWQPFGGTRVLLGQSFIRIHSPEPSDTLNAPTDTTSLAWFQDLPGGFDASLIYATTGAMSWARTKDLLKSEHQLDLRLAKSFRIGPTKAELSWTVQQANGRRQEYLPTYTFDRRAFATLRLEY